MMMVMKARRDNQLIEDDIVVANYLKKVVNNRKSRPSRLLQSQDVYCKNPWKLFPTRESLYDGLHLFVNRTEKSGKTDGCESGCWRIMGCDKLIKSEETGKILGFKKILKFCEKENRQPRRDLCIWVMEEYRLKSQWKENYVISKIRLLDPRTLEFLLSNDIRGNEMMVVA